MVVNSKIKTTPSKLLPHGEYVVSEGEPVRDLEQSTPKRFVQQRPGLLVQGSGALHGAFAAALGSEPGSDRKAAS
jgi:hypothetical protein